MASFIAKCYLQFEKLAHNPAVWFAEQAWFTRLALVLLILPATSASSIAWYQLQLKNNENNATTISNSYLELVKLRENWVETSKSQTQEISELKKELSDLKKQVMVLGINQDLTQTILGESVEATFSAELSSLEDASFSATIPSTTTANDQP